MSKVTLTQNDAVALIEKSSLCTVLTEGITDYTVMRKMEDRLRDLEIDFLPLGGKNMVLSVWKALSSESKRKVLAFVDLDEWIYTGIPDEFHENGVHYTIGYSIENDLFLDSRDLLIGLLNRSEAQCFEKNILHINSHHAAFIHEIKCGNSINISEKAYNLLLKDPPKLTEDHNNTLLALKSYYPQYLRGKTIFETLVQIFCEKGRFPKFGYDQIFHIAAANTSYVFSYHVDQIRERFRA